MSGQTAIERSLALHRAVAELLRADPSVLENARARVHAWTELGTVPTTYARAWTVLLTDDAEQVAHAIVATTEAMHELRQVSPFAGALAPRDRWRVLASVRSARP